MNDSHDDDKNSLFFFSRQKKTRIKLTHSSSLSILILTLFCGFDGWLRLHSTFLQIDFILLCCCFLFFVRLRAETQERMKMRLNSLAFFQISILWFFFFLSFCFECSVSLVCAFTRLGTAAKGHGGSWARTSKLKSICLPILWAWISFSCRLFSFERKNSFTCHLLAFFFCVVNVSKNAETLERNTKNVYANWFQFERAKASNEYFFPFSFEF